MKLMLLAAVVGAAVARPNGFATGPDGQPDFSRPIPGDLGTDGDELAMPASEAKGFMRYMDGLRKIFANPDNHAKLQEFFQSPEMTQWFFQHFHKRPSEPFPEQFRTNYQDKIFSKEEFQAWYPTLEKLAKMMNMEPVVAEEFAMIDTNGDQKITAEKLWTMLRDGVANKFFPSFMLLAFSESTKHMPGPFWSAAKRNAFQRGIWGQIAGLRPISDRAIKELADEIEKTQGAETAENFMVDMGMGSELSSDSLPVQTNDGQGQVDIKVEDGTAEDDEVKEPRIEASTPILTTNGQTMPAAKVAEDDSLTPVEGAPIPVKMPDGKTVMMSIGEEANDEKPQPMATLESASGEKFQMPVVSTTANDDGTSTTKILTPEGSTMEVKMPTPKEEPAGVANDEALGGVVTEPAQIEDKSKGLRVPATASPAEPGSDAAEDACIGLDSCKPTEVTANGIKMTIPVETDGEEEIKMTVENIRTGQATELKEVETEFDEATGELSVEGKTADGTKMTIKIPANQPEGLQNDEGEFQIAPTLLGPAITVSDDEGKPIITAQVDSIKSNKLPNGGEETVLKGKINGSPTKITITRGEGSSDPKFVAPEGMSADEMSEIEMKVKIEGKPEQRAEVVAADDETITGQLPDGTLVKAPQPDKVDQDETVELESPSGRKMELPILSAQTTPDKSAEQIVASNGQAKMTVTVTGA